MKPTRYTILLIIFISTSVHISFNYVPIIRRPYFIYATLVHFVLYAWLSGVVVEMRLIPTSTPESHPYRVKNTGVA